MKLENYQRPDEFGNWLGYRLLEANRESHFALTELVLRKEHLSMAGRVHGGVVSAFLDFSCGAAVFTTLGPKDFASTVELKVNYFRPLEAGQVLKARCEVKFRGKRLCVVHGLVARSDESEPVAMVTATFNVVSP